MVKKFKVNLKDRKILAELDWDARLSCAEIGRRIGLPKNVVEYRIKQLEKNKVILGYYPVINYIKLGYFSRRVLLKMKFLNTKIKKNIEDYIIKNKSLGWAIWTNGEYDLVIATRIKNPKDFLDELRFFLVKFDKYIDSRIFGESMGMIEFPMKFLLDAHSEKSINLNSPIENITLEELDKKIISLLQRNARISITELSQKLHVSQKTASKRLNNLYQEKIILGARTLINLKFFEKDYYKVLLKVDLSKKDSVKNITEYLLHQKEVCYIVDYISNEDIDFEIYVNPGSGLKDFMNNLFDKFETIQSYKFIKFEETIKIEYLPL